MEQNLYRSYGRLVVEGKSLGALGDAGFREMPTANVPQRGIPLF
jgi:hypothetical protein